MDIFFWIKYGLSKVARYFFAYLNSGEKCVICDCDTVLLPICEKCVDEHFNLDSRFYENRCNFCGRLLVCEDDVCFECREKVVFRNVDFVMPLFSYRLWNKELMFMWKSMKVRCLSDFFAELIGEALIELGVKVVVPVPPRYGKIKEIGWDQVDELCNILEHRFGFKILRVLERKSVFQQKKLSRDERLESISEAYALRPFKKLKKILKPFHDHFPSSVWLLDDVCTTGATLEACAMNLKKAGIEKVNAITLFGVD